MAAELESLEARKQELQEKLKSDPIPPVRLYPNLADVYRQKVENLRAALDHDDARHEASEIRRGLIEEIRLTLVDGSLGIYLVGNLAAILYLCAKKGPGATTADAQVTLVAGTRTHLYRTVLVWFARRHFG